MNASRPWRGASLLARPPSRWRARRPWTVQIRGWLASLEEYHIELARWESFLELKYDMLQDEASALRSFLQGVQAALEAASRSEGEVKEELKLLLAQVGEVADNAQAAKDDMVHVRCTEAHVRRMEERCAQ